LAVALLAVALVVTLAGAFFAPVAVVDLVAVAAFAEDFAAAALLAVTFAGPLVAAALAVLVAFLAVAAVVDATLRAAAFAGAVAAAAVRAAAFTGAVAAAATDPAAARPVAGANFGRLLGFLTYDLNDVPARNRGALARGMRTEVPVCGLRPVRAARSTRSNVPKPVIETFPPRTTSRTMVSRTASRASLAALRLPSRFSSSLTRSALFTVDHSNS
jgi:hypothetical protein